MPSNGYHDKIRKILAMLEGAKTEGEAKAANLALQRLLAKSNLTAEQVGALGSEDPSASIEEEPVYIGSNDVVWKRMLASAIAENLRCRVMLTAFPDKPRAKIIVFVGHAEDAAVASECYRLTLKVAQRCFKLYSKSCRDSGCPIDVTVTAVRNAYYIGFLLSGPMQRLKLTLHGSSCCFQILIDSASSASVFIGVSRSTSASECIT